MNSKNLIYIILLIISYNFIQAQECNTDGPYYFTIQNLNVYQNLNTESAITYKINAKEKVKVVDSFHGSLAWWKICYNNKSGWVKKTLLSENNPKNNNEVEYTDFKNINEELTDVGFRPFIGKTKGNTNFRKSPSTSSNIITQLQGNTQIYIFSDQTIDGFYKAIDLNTANIGWFSKGLISWIKDVETNSSSGFQSTGQTSNYQGEIKITNKSQKKIPLVVGSEIYYIAPKSTITKFVYPGKTNFIATVAGVIPSSGYQTFNSYESYEWQFWIETRRR